MLASDSEDYSIRLWNITSGTLLRTLSGHSAKIYNSIDSIDNGTTLVSGGADSKIKFWNWSTGGTLSTFDASAGIQSLAVVYVWTETFLGCSYSSYSCVSFKLFFKKQRKARNAFWRANVRCKILLKYVFTSFYTNLLLNSAVFFRYYLIWKNCLNPLNKKLFLMNFFLIIFFNECVTTGSSLSLDKKTLDLKDYCRGGG